MIFKKNKFVFRSILLLLLVVIRASGQETVVVGQVLDKADRMPLESVSVYFKGTKISTQTNEEGYFLIRNQGSETVLVFSLLGYEKEELKVKPGESVGVEMLLDEKINVLGELFVIPGANPANDLMRKVRRNRNRNNVRTNLQNKEQSLVFLSKNDVRWENNRLFGQFKQGNLSQEDSLLLVPLYLEESLYKHTGRSKEQLAKNTFNTSEASVKIISGLLNGLAGGVNFYNNSVSVMGKSMVSPLANVGGTFYRYYLMDSLQTDSGKEYLLRFKSKNTKNLAFNGELRIDSATYALTYINAELPRQANLNFIHNLRFTQSFQKTDSFWIPKNEKSAWNMTYELLKDVNKKSPELFVSRASAYSAEEGNLIITPDSFANSAYSRQLLEEKMEAAQQAPLYKTAAYIADVVLTGYARIGIFDMGQIINVARITKAEGFRLSLPIRTNEHLWKNFMLGGHLAYGFGDKQIKYSTEFQWKLPIDNSRVILGASYLDDYRRIDYDYTNFLWREDPLASGDENIVSTIFSFKSQNRISKRKEFTAFLYNDWSPNVESKWIYRDVTYLPNELLPLTQGGNSFPSLRDRNFSVTTRFSFGERVVDEHFQRLYLKQNKPVVYAALEGGRYAYGEVEDNYARISASLLHRGQFSFGEWRYMAEAGKIFGSVPYPLLKFIQGKEGGAYNRFEFSMMNNREYLADTYGTLFTEVITNGILFNSIPLIKHLNLREIASFKMAYGTLRDAQKNRIDIPGLSGSFTKPYSEVSLGLCNLLGVFSVQSIWRLSDLDKPDIKKWGIKFNVMVTF